MIMQLVGFLILASTIYFSTTTVEKNPKLRTFWTIVGCLMFFTGALCLIVNSVGLQIGFLMWIELMGVLGSFLFKIGLIFGGIAVVILANHNPEAYDEYFDGKKYQ
ncbi:MAG: Unknown protein [uncultured Aureispira sp.]|uniref:Uncharacterized protein n=1 Tax=uncultured Aureispira sp. TaxID=1331704 RepID=A0A6S6U688_9BACT|nr:MAG: Unknown protein [uncultured Aureispira sp.]